MTKIVRFDDTIHDESELFVCQSCGTELHVDCVGQKCPVCDTEINDEQRLLSDQERLANKQKQIADELKQLRERRLVTKDIQISLALASLDHAKAGRLIKERVNLLEQIENDAQKKLTADQSAESILSILLDDLEHRIVENMNKPKQQHNEHCFAWANSANNSVEFIRRINLITN